MAIELQTALGELLKAGNVGETISEDLLARIIADAKAAHAMDVIINNPYSRNFLVGVKHEAAHQRDRWGQPAERGKSAENWFWLVGYLAGKCLRAAITGDRDKALHHTISTAAACANWYEAISRDTTRDCSGEDKDIKPVELTRFEGGAR